MQWAACCLAFFGFLRIGDVYQVAQMRTRHDGLYDSDKGKPGIRGVMVACI